MLPLLLAAVLATPLQDQAERREVRTMLIENLDGMRDILTNFASDIEQGFPDRIQRIDTGMLLESRTDPGADGLHALEVTGVFTNGPADEAGIQPGDRITYIGKRRIEHETTEVVEILLQSIRGPILLTVLHDSSACTAMIAPRVLQCAQEALTIVDRRKWLENIDTFQAIIEALRQKLAQQPENAETLLEVSEQVERLSDLLPKLIDTVSYDLGKAIRTTCKVRFQ